ncbi:hypothetical protein [Rhodopirellula baltica]
MFHGNGYVIGRSDEPLSLGAVSAALLPLCPDFEYTGDYFGNRITRQEQIATELNVPLDAAPLESTRDAARRFGPQPAFVFSVDSTLAFSGRLSARGIMLHSNRKFTETETSGLRACLVSLGLDLETFCG